MVTMPNSLLIVAVSFVLVGMCSGYGNADTNGEFKVSGRVLCQDCSEGWNEWVNARKPIQGSTVSVTCYDDRTRVVQYESDLTDKEGNFEITCKKFVNRKEMKPNNCYLRLVSSPDPVCNVLTDFAGGKTGVKLGRPTMVYRDTTKYVLGPFYYTTPMCEEPDTNGPAEDDDSNDSGDNGKQNNYY